MEEVQPAGGKWYSIFQVTTEQQGGLASFCFKVIGWGATFSVTKNCSVTHKEGGALMAVMPGDVFMAKNKATSAFVAPLLDGHRIHDSVTQDWKNGPLSL
jgi:hypothetical protein